MWQTNGVLGDAGTASNPVVSTFGVVNNGGPGFCVDTGLPSSAGYQQFCLSASLNGAAQISLQNYGSATAQNICFNVNGTQTCIPTGGGTGTIPTITTPTVLNAPICAADVNGNIKDCTTGTNGQIFVGQTSGVPLWKSLSGDVASINAAGAVTLGGVNGVVFPASPSTGTAPYVSSTNTITYGQIPVTGGGTGAATFATAGVLVGNGTAPVSAVTTASIGLCLLSQGTGVTPTWGGCASGAGSAAGPNNSIQYNNSSALAGSANLIWVSPALTIGVNATATGQLVLANGGALGTSITVQNNSATTAYNFNLPISSGTAGQPMISGGGGSSAMQFSTLGIIGGGTNCTSASGTCLDNITGFNNTGFLNRTGAGTYTFAPQIGLANGGTGANLTASNGGIVYSTASALAILSGTATANQIPLSGSNSAPAWSTATYPATTTINQILWSSSANTIVGLATANSATLITSSGGVPSLSQTLPSAVQANITTVGTIGTGVWQGTPIALAYGGTNANLTASNGGIFYSTASAGAILSGTATANQPLLSGSSTAPSWSGISYPASATSGGIPYFSSTSAMASSGLLTNHAIVLGGGAGSAPTVLGSLGTSTTVLHGASAGAPTFGSVVLSTDVSGSLPLSNLASQIDSSIVSNISGGSAAPAANTITSVLDYQFGTTQGTVVYRGAATWAALTPGSSGQFLTSGGASANVSWSSGGAGTGTVTSVTPGSGLVSSVASSCSQSAITAAGTLYSAECVNAQTGTSYAILDADRAKLVTASNAAAQAYSIAQAGNSSAFQAGWYTDIHNISTNVAGVVTITPATSTINGASTLVIQPGQNVRIVSDGTNYQIVNLALASQLPGTATNDAANAGNIGEYVSSVIASGSSVTFTSATDKTVTSISLTAGDWDISGIIYFVTSANAVTSYYLASISQTNNAVDTTSGAFGSHAFPASFVIGAGLAEGVVTPTVRKSLSGTTTIYLVGSSTFTVGGLTGYGAIRARRVR